MLILIAGDSHTKGGTILANPTTTVFINEVNNIATASDPLSPYEDCPTPTMTATKNEKVFINGRAVCVTTDVDSCGTPITSSTNSKVFIQT